MPLENWPDPTDDSGTGTDGTAVDSGWADDLRASIEDALYDGGNPTVSPADTTAEVIAARSGQDTLNDRLDAIEGDLGGVVTPDSSSLAGSENVARNPDLKGWKSGSATAPDGFTLSGTGAAVGRTGPSDSDTTNLGAGHTAKITYGSATAKLTQITIETADFTLLNAIGLDGRNFSVTARVKASIASMVRIAVTDGVTTSNSAYHTGGGNPESLTVSHPLSGSATKLEFYVEVVQAGSAYVGGFVATFTDSPAPSWSPPPRMSHRVLDINVTPAGNVGAPETSLMQYRLSPNMLRASGTTIHIMALGDTAANATAKTLKFKYGSVSFTLFTGGQNNKGWAYDIWIFRVDASTQYVFVIGALSTAQLCLRSSASADETAEILCEFTGDANVNNDIVQRYMMVEIIEPGAGL